MYATREAAHTARHIAINGQLLVALVAETVGEWFLKSKTIRAGALPRESGRHRLPANCFVDLRIRAKHEAP